MFSWNRNNLEQVNVLKSGFGFWHVLKGRNEKAKYCEKSLTTTNRAVFINYNIFLLIKLFIFMFYIVCILLQRPKQCVRSVEYSFAKKERNS